MIHPFSSIRSMRAALAAREISVAELLDMAYARIAAYDKHIGSALEWYDRTTVQMPSNAEGALYGIPGLLKDNICVKGRPMQCASRVLMGYHAPYSATVTTRVESQGSMIIGRANMDEFAMGSSTETSAFLKTRNPWDITRVAGGSSGGSAAAVAAGFVPWAFGSETGGSVRQPAALCNLVAMKPTYGLVSRHGLTAYASSTDQVSPFTRTVYDNALVLSVIAGQESPVRDSTARPAPNGGYDFTKDLRAELPRGIRVGVIMNALDAEGVDPEVKQLLRASIAQLESLGASIQEVRLPSMELSAAVYFVVSRAEASSNLARFDGVRYGYRSPRSDSLTDLYVNSRSEGFGAEVQRRILVGNYVLTKGHADAYYRRACEVRDLMRAETAKAFESVDCLFAPVSPTGAFVAGSLDEMALDLQDYFTCFANLVGIPALAVPCGFLKSGLPMGFQIMGAHWSEELLYQVGYAYEQSTPWHTKFPDLDVTCRGQ